jgi:peptidoglycan/xylan/chitin deacetylase (PgdA/CDA1 family)
MKAMCLPVLMYHHVGPLRPSYSRTLSVSPSQFEKQIRFLKRRGYVGIHLSDCVAWLRHGAALPEKAVLLTFDDALADLHEHAFPLLTDYGFGAVVFVVTDCIGKTNIWDQQFGYGHYPCLTAEQIRYWAAKGIDFGSHSRTHPDLRDLDAAQLRDEIAGSRSDLEDVLGAPVVSFAYPYGHFNGAVADCAGQHFDLAFTILEGLNTSQTGHALLHRSIALGTDGPLDLELRVRLGWNPVRRLRERLRLRARLSSAFR